MAAQSPPMRSDSGDTDVQMPDMMNGLHESSSEKSPRFGNLGFLKGFTERKTTRGKQISIDPLLLPIMMLNTSGLQTVSHRSVVGPSRIVNLP